MALEQLGAATAMVMGRRTYEVCAGVWPGRDGDYADAINAIPHLWVHPHLPGVGGPDDLLLLLQGLNKMFHLAEARTLGSGVVVQTLTNPGARP